jgi:hypothetical protein
VAYHCSRMSNDATVSFLSSDTVTRPMKGLGRSLRSGGRAGSTGCELDCDSWFALTMSY